MECQPWRVSKSLVRGVATYALWLNREPVAYLSSFELCNEWIDERGDEIETGVLL